MCPGPPGSTATTGTISGVRGSQKPLLTNLKVLLWAVSRPTYTSWGCKTANARDVLCFTFNNSPDDAKYLLALQDVTGHQRKWGMDPKSLTATRDICLDVESRFSISEINGRVFIDDKNHMLFFFPHGEIHQLLVSRSHLHSFSDWSDLETPADSETAVSSQFTWKCWRRPAEKGNLTNIFIFSSSRQDHFYVNSTPDE